METETETETPDILGQIRPSMSAVYQVSLLPVSSALLSAALHCSEMMEGPSEMSVHVPPDEVTNMPSMGPSQSLARKRPPR